MAITPIVNTPPPGAKKATTDRGTPGGITPGGVTDGGADRLRDHIDHGETGDKVDYPDPSAAPLGTDDEAGGYSPTPEEVALAQRHETRQGDRANTARPGDPLHGKTGPNMALYGGIAVVALLLVVWLIR
ncbi:MAG: hypothetical protein ACK4GT_13640 [Pararhodobacter sp.]